MKKLLLSIVTLLVFAMSVAISPVKAEYMSEHDKYIEVTTEQAQAAAELLGLENFPLNEETAQMSFELQEELIEEMEALLGTEIDHYYIWLTINGEPVLAIDPPVVLI